jgi:hypothetical protein
MGIVFFLKHHDLSALFLGTMLFQASWFLKVVSKHYAFSSTVVS